MANPKYKVHDVVKAIESTKGLLTMAARRLGCSPQTIHNYMARYPEVQQAIDNEREKMTDIAELSLYKQIQDGAPWAISMYLKTIGRSRGYGDQVNVRHGGDEDAPPIKAEIVNIDADIYNREFASLLGIGDGTGDGDADAQSEPRLHPAHADDETSTLPRPQLP